MSTVDNQNVEPAVTESAAPVIQIADLQNAVQIIDYACEQGAFKGWKVIEQVIAVREKLATFVAATVPPAAPAVPEADAAKPAAKSAAKKSPAKTAPAKTAKKK